MIGSFGQVNFLVSSWKIRTFDDFRRSASPRWVTHDIIGKKPVSQFIGPGLDQISFSIRFDVRYYMRPKIELDRLTKMERSGEVAKLIIGGDALGVNKWYITSLEQEWQKVDNEGNLLVAQASITLQEYAR
ncbi:phage tail protein [Paenibacillus azoreducens]|uniref:phage tail protein n=1 Tax=Paenibacillus azoreducens TaxID=116718 RepID=UPI0039F5EFB8